MPTVYLNVERLHAGEKMRDSSFIWETEGLTAEVDYRQLCVEFVPSSWEDQYLICLVQLITPVSGAK